MTGIMGPRLRRKADGPSAGKSAVTCRLRRLTGGRSGGRLGGRSGLPGSELPELLGECSIESLGADEIDILDKDESECLVAGRSSTFASSAPRLTPGLN
jgi:hypothetical protein